MRLQTQPTWVCVPNVYGPLSWTASCSSTRSAPTPRAALAAAGHARKYPKASLVFSAGDEGHEVLIVRSGAVKVVVSALNGREVILDVLHGGEVLGELSAVDGGPRSATVVTLEPTEVLAVSQREFRRLMTEHADIGATLLAVLAARLRDADRRQLEFGANDAIARVCHRLLELRQRYGRVDPDGRIVIDVPFSQADLAN